MPDDEAVNAFNALPAAELAPRLSACCAAPAWVDQVTAGRPYADRATLIAAGRAAAAGLSWPDVAQALSAHPRIGEQAAGESTEAAWSRREQSIAVETAGEESRTALTALNQAYERRFGHVFLIFATGRSQDEIVAAMAQRLTNDEATERTVVTGELARIAALRLERLLDALG